MSKTLTTVAWHVLLALFFASLIGVVGCGGGAGKSKDDEEETVDPPEILDLSGTVLASDGSPIADAIVTARLGDGSNSVLDIDTSGADGTYLVNVPEGTAFYLHAAKTDYATSNSHIRVITAMREGVDIVLLLVGEADDLLSTLGGPSVLGGTDMLFLVRALDPLGAELTGVSVNVTPVGLLLLYRLADDTGYAATGPTVACTATGGCGLPQMAGYSTAVYQGVSTFRYSPAGGGTLAAVPAPLAPGEVTFIAND